MTAAARHVPPLRPIMGRDKMAAFIAGKLTHLAQN